MAAKKEHGFSVQGSFERVFDAAARATQHCGWRLDVSQPQTGSLRAIHGMNLMTYGEKIDVSVRPRPDGVCDVWVKSECRGIQMVDYGRNRKNIDAFVSALMTELQAPPQTWQPTPQQPAQAPWPGPPPAAPMPAGQGSGRFCSACGAPGQVTDRFCRGCGEPAS